MFNMFYAQFLQIFYEISEVNISKTFTSSIKLVYHMPENSLVELVQLVKFFLPVRPNFTWRFNFMFDNPRNFESQCYDCIFM